MNGSIDKYGFAFTHRIIAKSFIRRCLTVNPEERITAHEALNHPWLSSKEDHLTQDLLPTVRRNFNARRTFKKAVDVVRLSQQLRNKRFSATASSLTNEEAIKQAENEIKPISEGIDQVLKI